KTESGKDRAFDGTGPTSFPGSSGRGLRKTRGPHDESSERSARRRSSRKGQRSTYRDVEPQGFPAVVIVGMGYRSASSGPISNGSLRARFRISRVAAPRSGSSDWPESS